MSENKTAKTPADDGQPVAWMMVNKVIGPPSLHWKPQEDWHITWECKPLYTAPPKRELTCVCGAAWEGETMVHPPRKREWVGLTDDEIGILSCEMVKGDKSVNWLCKVLEAKLKEKNQ
jgi:hypothetical protein